MHLLGNAGDIEIGTENRWMKIYFHCFFKVSRRECFTYLNLYALGSTFKQQAICVHDEGTDSPVFFSGTLVAAHRQNYVTVKLLRNILILFFT
jgi:hypothetical protein